MFGWPMEEEAKIECTITVNWRREDGSIVTTQLGTLDRGACRSAEDVGLQLADAKMMSEDAEEALVEIESGDTAGGYYTSTVVVFDEDRQKVEAVAKQVEKAINNAGFTARVESLNTMDALIGSLPGHGVQNVRRPYVSVFNQPRLSDSSAY
jgi:type IV secretory pathway VirB4 component